MGSGRCVPCSGGVMRTGWGKGGMVLLWCLCVVFAYYISSTFEKGCGWMEAVEEAKH